MAVEAVGAGYFVRADVATRLALSCDCCLATFEHPVATQFQARKFVTFEFMSPHAPIYLHRASACAQNKPVPP